MLLDTWNITQFIFSTLEYYSNKKIVISLKPVKILSPSVVSDVGTSRVVKYRHSVLMMFTDFLFFYFTNDRQLEYLSTMMRNDFPAYSKKSVQICARENCG